MAPELLCGLLVSPESPLTIFTVCAVQYILAGLAAFAFVGSVAQWAFVSRGQRKLDLGSSPFVSHFEYKSNCRPSLSALAKRDRNVRNCFEMRILLSKSQRKEPSGLVVRRRYYVCRPSLPYL